MASDPVIDRGMLADYCAGVSITTIAARYHFEDAEDVLRALERALQRLERVVTRELEARRRGMPAYPGLDDLHGLLMVAEVRASREGYRSP